jgi:hypothetical protein
MTTIVIRGSQLREMDLRDVASAEEIFEYWGPLEFTNFGVSYILQYQT